MNSERKEEKVEEKEYSVEKILNKRITDEGKLEYYLKWKGLPDSDNAWKHFIEILDYPELIRAYEDSLEYKSLEKRRKLSATEDISNEPVQKKKAYAKDSDGVLCNINSLPVEIIIKIFEYLTHNELGRVAQVCQRWNDCTQNPVLWKKVDVQFNKHNESQNELSMNFIEKLRTFVTHLKLNFKAYCICEEKLNFEMFCVKLEKRCPDLQALVLHNAEFTLSFQSIIDLCSQYLPNLQVLVLRWCKFSECYTVKEYSGESNIEVLDVCGCLSIGRYCKLPLSAVIGKSLPYLRKLHLACTNAINTWFNDNASFLHQLEVLNLGGSFIDFRTFQTLQNHALNLTELYLCYNPRIKNNYFDDSVFPQLKIICLRGCFKVTCEGIVSLIQSCHSLQDVNVDREVVASYAVHPFAVANNSMFKIVKNIPKCAHFERLNYLYDY